MTDSTYMSPDPDTHPAHRPEPFAPARGCAAPEVRKLIEEKMRSCLESAASAIRRLYFKEAWAHIDEAQIYRNALLPEDQQHNDDYATGRNIG